MEKDDLVKSSLQAMSLVRREGSVAGQVLKEIEKKNLDESRNIITGDEENVRMIEEKDKVVTETGMPLEKVEGELTRSPCLAEAVIYEAGDMNMAANDSVSLQGEFELNLVDVDVDLDFNGSFLHEANNAVGDICVPVAPKSQPTGFGNLVEIVDEQTKSNDVSESGFSHYLRDGSKKVDLVVDLNEYALLGGKWNDGGTGMKHVSSDVEASISDTAVENDASHSDDRLTVADRWPNKNKPEKIVKQKLDTAVLGSGFSVSDLVWGKVRSHPWWPGQIFNPTVSSKKATKYSKEGSFLIAYFGDGTFAWNDVSRLKAFHPHFSQMEKQSSLESFRHAVDCALDEVAKRVEFGLSCPCLPYEIYSKVRTQIVVNSGIEKELRRRGVRDEYSNGASFQPLKLVYFVKELSKVPHKVVDRLELVIAQAELLSFYRWKGHPGLAEFRLLGGLVENDSDISHSGEKKDEMKFIKDSTSSLYEDNLLSGKGVSTVQHNVTRGKSGHTSGPYKSPSKKEKALSESMDVNRSDVSHNARQSMRKVGTKPVSSSSSMKRKADAAVPDKSDVKARRILTTERSINNTSEFKESFNIGNRISRVASQLNGTTSILKNAFRIAQRNAAERKSKGKTSNDNKFQKASASYKKCLSSAEILSELCLAATEPLEGHNFSDSMLAFFSDFRNSVCLDCPNSPKKEQFPEKHHGMNIGEKSLVGEAIGTREVEYVKDSYWTDMVIEGNAEEQILMDSQNETRDIRTENIVGNGLPSVESKVIPGWRDILDSKQPHVGGDRDFVAGEQINGSDKVPAEESSRAALILNFADPDSVPSETYLNKIFSRFGPLSESETEILKANRAKVVFKRRDDAETAFSSAGKFSIFGPSLVSYRLKYCPYTPQKASSSSTKQGKKGRAT